MVAERALPGSAEEPGLHRRAFLSGKQSIEVPALRRPIDRKRQLTVVGAREHNLRGIDARFRSAC